MAASVDKLLDVAIQKKVNMILKEPLLDRNTRAGLVFSKLSVQTNYEKRRFIKILDYFMEQFSSKKGPRC